MKLKKSTLFIGVAFVVGVVFTAIVNVIKKNHEEELDNIYGCVDSLNENIIDLYNIVENEKTK